MNDNDIKQKVTDWWVAGCEFEAGIDLYLRHGKNKCLKSTMPGRPETYSEKLRYELCKSVGLDWLKMPKITGIQHKPKQPQVIQAKTLIKDFEQQPEPRKENTDAYPAVIRKLINEYAECYRERSVRHTEMADIPEENSKENCQRRAELLIEIKKLSARMDILHFARIAYSDHKEMPDEAKIWPEEAKAEEDNILPDNLEDLKRMKKDLQVSMVKDRNLLDYQQKTKLDKKCPMPEGPKRKGIEKRIAWKLKRIETIDYKIVDLT